MALRFAVEDQGRRVTDLERSAVCATEVLPVDIPRRLGICSSR